MAEMRVKLWEEKLFSQLDAKEGPALRMKKVVEISKLETEAQIDGEIQGILRRREEQRKKEAELARQQAAAASFGDVMSQLNAKFKDRDANSVDDAELAALMELEAQMQDDS